MKFRNWLIKILDGVPKCEFDALESEFTTFKNEKTKELQEKEKEISRLKQYNTENPMSKRRIVDIATYYVEPISLQTVYRIPQGVIEYNSEVLEETIAQDLVKKLCETIVKDKLYRLKYTEYDPMSMCRECLVELKIYPPQERSNR